MPPTILPRAQVIFSALLVQGVNIRDFSWVRGYIPDVIAMPVPAANGCCLDSQQEEDGYILKNSTYPEYVCQGNLQGLRSSWAAKNCLISEFLLYLTDYQGEKALAEYLKPLIQLLHDFLTILAVLICKCFSYHCEWSYTNTVTYRCICCVIICVGVIVLKIGY